MQTNPHCSEAYHELSSKARECYESKAMLSYHSLLEKLSDGAGRKTHRSKGLSRCTAAEGTCRCHVLSLGHTVTCRMLTQTSHLQEALHCAASYKVRDGASWETNDFKFHNQKQQQASNLPTIWLELLWLPNSLAYMRQGSQGDPLGQVFQHGGLRGQENTTRNYQIIDLG